MEKIIFHIDVNNAFLSWTAVDMLRKGSTIDIRTIPSIIGGDESKRHGIVLAKSTPAKKMGIKTADTIYNTRKICRNIKVFPADYDLYEKESNKLFNLLTKYTPIIERYSIDECFLDMSGTKFLYNNLEELAYKIKDEVEKNLGFTVNIGIGNNKLCAKMASDFEKPNKVHTLYKEEIETKMWPLLVGELFMIGKASTIKLNEIGIYTVKDLATCDINKLKKHFKNQSTFMWEYANGIDNSVVNFESDKNKCISISTTLLKDTDDIEELRKVLFRLADSIGRSLRKQQMYANVIGLTVRTSDFVDSSIQTSLLNGINKTDDIYNNIIKLFTKKYVGVLIRNIGIRLSDLSNILNKQEGLFDTVKYEDKKMDKLVDDLKEKFGDDKVTIAALKDK